MKNSCGVHNKIFIDNFIKHSKKGKLKYSLEEIKKLDYTDIGISISETFDKINIYFSHKFFEIHLNKVDYKTYIKYFKDKDLKYSVEILDKNILYIGYGDIIVDLVHDKFIPMKTLSFYDADDRLSLQDIWDECCNQDEQYYLHFGYDLPCSLHNNCLEFIWNFIEDELITLIDFKYEKELGNYLDSIVKNVYNNNLHKVKFFKGIESHGSYNASVLRELFEINFDINKQIISILRFGDKYTMWYDNIYLQDKSYLGIQDDLYSSEDNEYHEFKFSEILGGNFEYIHLDRVKLIEFVETFNYIKSILN